MFDMQKVPHTRPATVQEVRAAACKSQDNGRVTLPFKPSYAEAGNVQRKGFNTATHDAEATAT